MIDKKFRDVMNKNIFDDPYLFCQFFDHHGKHKCLKGLKPEDFFDFPSEYEQLGWPRRYADCTKSVTVKHMEKPITVIAHLEHMSGMDFSMAFRTVEYKTYILQRYEEKYNLQVALSEAVAKAVDAASAKASSAASAAPVAPAASATPVVPAATVVPAAPAASVDPVVAVASASTVSPAASAAPVASVSPVVPAASVVPAAPAVSAAPVALAASAAPVASATDLVNGAETILAPEIVSALASEAAPALNSETVATLAPETMAVLIPDAQRLKSEAQILAYKAEIDMILKAEMGLAPQVSTKYTKTTAKLYKAPRKATMLDEFRYPPVFSYVFYTGLTAWTAETDMKGRTLMSDLHPDDCSGGHYTLIELSKIPDKELLGYGDVFSFLAFLTKHSHSFIELQNDLPVLKVEMKKLGDKLNEEELEKVANISYNLFRNLGMSIEEATKLVNLIKERRIDDMFEDLISSVHEMEDEKDKIIADTAEEKDKAVEEKDKAVEEKVKALEAKRIILRNSIKVLFSQGKTAEDIADILEADLSEVNPIYDEVSAQCSA
jgi:hypothetical protein